LLVFTTYSLLLRPLTGSPLPPLSPSFAPQILFSGQPRRLVSIFATYLLRHSRFDLTAHDSLRMSFLSSRSYGVLIASFEVSCQPPIFFFFMLLSRPEPRSFIQLLLLPPRKSLSSSSSIQEIYLSSWYRYKTFSNPPYFLCDFLVERFFPILCVVPS